MKKLIVGVTTMCVLLVVSVTATLRLLREKGGTDKASETVQPAV